jgi:hypothetical protein
VLSLVAALALVATLATPAPAYDVVSVTDGGVLAGVVRFAGTASRLSPLPVARDPHVSGDHQDAEPLGVARGKRPSAEVTLDSSRCAFVGHVTVVMAGERGYRVTMWHESFRPRGRDRDGRPRYDTPRTVRKDVTIAPGATATIDFELR